MTAGWMIALVIAVLFAAFGVWMDLCSGWHPWRTKAIRMSEGGHAYEADQVCRRCGRERVWRTKA